METLDIITQFNNTTQYEVPVDPMDELHCDSCQ